MSPQYLAATLFDNRARQLSWQQQYCVSTQQVSLPGLCKGAEQTTHHMQLELCTDCGIWAGQLTFVLHSRHHALKASHTS